MLVRFLLFSYYIFFNFIFIYSTKQVNLFAGSFFTIQLIHFFLISFSYIVWKRVNPFAGSFFTIQLIHFFFRSFSYIPWNESIHLLIQFLLASYYIFFSLYIIIYIKLNVLLWIYMCDISILYVWYNHFFFFYHFDKKIIDKMRYFSFILY